MADLMRTLLGYGFRVDPDHRQDRGSSPCTSRAMTPEEIEKYGPPKKEYRHSISSVMAMTRKDNKKLWNQKVDKKQFIEACKKHGTKTKNYKAIAEELGIAQTTVRDYVHKWKVRELLKSLFTI